MKQQAGAHAIPEVIRALRFRESDGRTLQTIARREWQGILNAADDARMTVPLALRCQSLFPPKARARLDSVLRKNALCHDGVVSAYRQIADVFAARGVDFTLLKGLSQWPWYVDDARHRFQSDIDLYCRASCLDEARNALEGLGYEAVYKSRANDPVDHLPVMIRRTGWKWRGEYYDPVRPPSVELHFRVWDADTEGFPAVDEEAFWNRRVNREIGGIVMPTLRPADGLTYSAMHLVRHLLRGSLQIRHAYELAHFLERSADDHVFWNEWHALATHSRLIEGVAFRLASDWFGCRIHPLAERAIDQLPVPVDQWFELFGMSPATASMRPNKDELWLHLSIVPDKAARRRIVRRRLIPVSAQRVGPEPHVKNAGTPPAVHRRLYDMRHRAARAGYHLRSLVPLLRSGLRWWAANAASHQNLHRRAKTGAAAPVDRTM